MAFSVSTILLFSVLCLTSMSAVQSKEGEVVYVVEKALKSGWAVLKLISYAL